MYIIQISPISAINYKTKDLNIKKIMYKSWQFMLATNIIKYYPKTKIDCVYLNHQINKITNIKMDNINFYMIPTLLNKNKSKEKRISIELMTFLKKRISDNPILHFHKFHGSYMTYFIGSIFKDVPKVIHHHGGLTPQFKFQINKNPFFLIDILLEKIMIPNIDYYLIGSKIELDRIKSILKDKNNYTLFKGGVDYNFFKPINKELARSRVGIKLESKVILYVGKLSKLKGVDNILWIYNTLKLEIKNLICYCIGGDKKDPLYNEVKKSGINLLSHISKNKLIDYYNSADVYLLPTFNKSILDTGGIGTAPIEAMACNIPVISSTLKDFENINEIKNVGVIPKNKYDALKLTKEILLKKREYKNCRDTSKIYYDWKPIIKKLFQIYNVINNRYYHN